MEDSVTKNTILLAGDDGEEDQDPFLRLPDELIISHLFDSKICEAKCLYRCSLVSKRFSSLVYQTHNIFFKIPRQQLVNDPKTCCFLLSPRKLKFVTTPLSSMIHWLFGCVLMEEPTAVDDLEFSAHSIAKILRMFTSLRSLHMEIDFSGVAVPLLKWKFNSKPYSFVLLVARSRIDINNVNADVDVDEDNNVVSNDILVELLGTRFVKHMDDAYSFWYPLLEKLLPLLPESLQNVVVTDSKKQGRFEIREDFLLEMRNQNADMKEKEVKMRVWHAPVINLPFSGSVIKMVTLLISRYNGSDAYDDYFLVKEAFDDGEEKVYVEVAMEMLKKEHVYDGIL